MEESSPRWIILIKSRMEAIRKLCERIKTFFIRLKEPIRPIIDDSKSIDENVEDIEFHVPPREELTPSSPTQLPTALEFLAQQRLACMAKDTDTQHSGENKTEDKQDVNNLD